VLPAGSRLRHRADFASTLRLARGTRAAGLVVVHVTVPARAADATASDRGADAAESDRAAEAAEPARVGFVVSRAVGPAVVRNRVKRRLRHLAARRLDRLPPGSRVVVRALPPAAAATFSQLDAALTRALEAGLARAGTSADSKAHR
jgi:ribonuclease P protein component